MTHAHRRPRTLFFSAALMALTIGTAGAASRHHHASQKAGTIPVELKSQPGTELDRQARSLNADLLEDAARHHEQPIILTGTAQLAPKQKDMILFVQLQSYRLCGSAGCTTSIYRKNGDKWDTLLDSVNGTIRIARQRHNGMADIVVDGNDRWVFDGQKYQDTLSSP
ncbi:hypothetical protein NQF87_04890 [Bombella sp. TMW 2.2559]|uniref:Lipoprotein n=1 Tax=Bombella dulcis TaxID=2967339 RepID=A0ABT3WD47_9PROT|nr:hypothetical protein [Bombella dulcis]MCX5616309.1 hypothetical protein [Bombella dulcis]